ncbi:cytochrome c oxidase assembly protein [Nesterenkonia alkaliphila]|nr:cytochrome c oxidase assembly protein [Nesterenkonia alkaliphila]
MATAVSAALFAAAILPMRGKLATGSFSQQVREEDELSPLMKSALLISGIAGLVWTGAALAVLVYSYSLIAGEPLSASREFSRGFFNYVQSVETGQAWIAVVAISATFTTGLFGFRSRKGVLLLVLLGLSAIIPIALVGHSASAENHTEAVTSLVLHILGLTLWVGGLFVLLLLGLAQWVQKPPRSRRSETCRELDLVVGRYSRVASVGLALTVASGVINGMLRIRNVSELLTSEYGVMLLVKTGATVLLAGIGFVLRQWVIPQIRGADDDSKHGPVTRLWRLIWVEALLMGAIIGVSTVLARTAPPSNEQEYLDATPALILTGYEMPPDPELTLWAILWRPDWLWTAVAITMAIWYLRSMWRLEGAGEKWPLSRSASWVLGVVLLVWATSGAPAVYGKVLFSAHILQLMVITFLIPVLLVFADPITLARRTARGREDGTRGPKEWLSQIFTSRVFSFLAHPLVSGIYLGVSSVLFSFTPAFRFSLEYLLGNGLMIAHFLTVGLIFSYGITGAYARHARGTPSRLFALVLLLALFAVLATVLSASSQVLEPEWFGVLAQELQISALADQQVGGKTLWVLPVALLAYFTVREVLHRIGVRAQLERSENEQA